ncbi:MAG: polysaccharide pyruvyl transferase CsaB [Bacillota bacterium]
MNDLSKLLISGYYGFDNLGDEAVLAGIVKLFKKIDSDIDITVLSADPVVSKKRYNINSISRTSLINIISSMAQADLFISGGGSLLQDITGKFSVSYYLGLIWLAVIQGTKTSFYAQGVGPLNRKFNRILTEFTLKKIDHIGVRDQASAELLQDIGIRDVELTVDPVFALYDEKEVVRRKLHSRISVGISVRPWHADYIDELGAGLGKFAQKYNCDFRLYPFHKGVDENPSKKLKTILDRTTVSDVIIEELAEDPYTAVKQLKDLNLFLGVRLHSLIFAVLNQLPFLAISYDPKIDGLMSEIEFLNTLDIGSFSRDDVFSELEYLLENRYDFRKRLKNICLEKKDEAQRFAESVFKEARL